MPKLEGEGFRKSGRWRARRAHAFPNNGDGSASLWLPSEHTGMNYGAREGGFETNPWCPADRLSFVTVPNGWSRIYSNNAAASNVLTELVQDGWIMQRLHGRKRQDATSENKRRRDQEAEARKLRR